MYFFLGTFFIFWIFGFVQTDHSQSSSVVFLPNNVAHSLCSQMLEYKSLRKIPTAVVKDSGIQTPSKINTNWIRTNKCDIDAKPGSCFPFRHSASTSNHTKNSRGIHAPNITYAEGYHPCLRQCSSDPAKHEYLVCYYKWELTHYWSLSSACGDCPKVTKDCFKRGCIPLDGGKRPISVVNHQFPGPSIRVCRGDTIIIDLKNDFFSEGTSIHWHGLTQKDTPWMDGVPQLTQCYIPPGTTFRYEFSASQYGTYFYHSHAAFQRADGIFGGLIIRIPIEREPFSEVNLNTYDYDLPEHEVLLMDWNQEMTVDLHMNVHFNKGSQKPHNILVNGKGFPLDFFSDFAPGESIEQKGKPFVPIHELRIAQDKRYRIRFISNGVLKCPLVTSIEGHDMIVIAADGSDLVPYKIESLVIYAGERWDVVVSGIQNPGSYWIKFQGLHDCKGDRFQLAVLNYEQVPEFTLPSRPITTWDEAAPPGFGLQLQPFNTAPGVPGRSISTAQLSNLNDKDPELSQTDHPDHQFYISYDFNQLPKDEIYFPGKKRVFDVRTDRVAQQLLSPQLNYFSGTLPKSPPLIQRETIPLINKCNSDIGFCGLNCTAVLCQCTHWLNVKLHSIVEIVIIDESKAFTSHHPFHIHGHEFRVVGQQHLPTSLARAELIQEKDRAELLPRRRANAIKKDVVPIPSPGYAILRFRANNAGMWYFHCHLDLHVEIGMNLVFQVGELHEIPKPPKNFPKCGDNLHSENKPPFAKSCRPLPTSGSQLINDTDTRPWCEYQKPQCCASAN